MPRILILILILILVPILLMLLAARAEAGAWPLPEGAGHLSLSVEGERGDGTGAYTTLYTEYGLTGRRTAGLDLGFAERDANKAVAFLRWHTGGQEDDDTRVAYEFGLGMVDESAALRPALSLGRPVVFGELYGWVSLDARGILFEDAEGRLEADVTLGGALRNGDKWLVQLQMAAPSDADTYAKIAPSYAFEQKKGRHLLLGVTAGVVGFNDVKLSLGLWQKF